MDKYPRIYSLSTIGIKQHFNCDYRFHHHRTDFSGESGSGKSMVADMIQLILVGSGAYKSSTKSNKVRDAKGMVLRSKEQYSVGYIFLNIEVEYEKYIVIGGYIESSHNKVLSFIIQSGYDWTETLKPLDKPIFYESLLDNNRLVQFETLVDLPKNFNIKSLSRKDYHRLLYKNQILALDLNKGKTLENYASIIRSFSRGKGFETDSNSLKTFLFGNDDYHRLQLKFEEEIRAINNDHIEHNRYLEEISLINKKQQSIKKVLELNKAYNDLKEVYLSNSVLFWNRITEEYQKEFDRCNEEYVIGQIKLHHVEIKLLEQEIDETLKLRGSIDHERRELEELTTKKEITDREYLNVEESYERVKYKKEAASKVEKWLKESQINLSDLPQWHHENKQRQREKELLTEFISYLDNENLKGLFEKSLWSKDWNQAVEDHEKQIQHLNKELDSKLSLSKFSDLENSDSLARWALSNLQFPLSIEKESLLVYAQRFPTVLPTSDISRYLKSPEQLFSNSQFFDPSEQGFWVNLEGIYEFIEFVSVAFLDEGNSEEIEKKLLSLNKGLKEQIIETENQIKELTDFSERLKQFQNAHLASSLYSSKEQIFGTDVSDIAKLTIGELEEHISNFENKKEVEQDFEQHKRKFQKTTSLFTQDSNEIARLKRSIQEQKRILNTTLFGKSFDEFTIEKRKLITKKTESLAELEQNSQLEMIKVQKEIDGLFSLNPDSSHLSKIKIQLVENDLKDKNELDKVRERYSNAKDKLASAQAKYFLEYKKEFTITSKSKEIDEDPEVSLSKKCIQSEEAFKSAYNLAIEELDDKNQLSGFSVGLLAHKLLPTVFISSKIDEDLIEDRISERLIKLTRDVQEIGSRKVEILKRVLTEVYEKYNEYLATIIGLDNYLKNKNRTITGGNRASISFKAAIGYPISWMAPFRKQLTIELNNIGLFESLKKEIDIHKMMLEAFRTARGDPKAQWEELLDPKSYFDLDFELRLESGASNAGSQGQTYTANALLGLARLSLIKEEKRKGIKIMPVDEAEGLGSNYDMLNKLAKDENFQILSMSIETAGDISLGEQFIYIMNENNLADVDSYVPPLGIFSDGELKTDLDEVTLKANESDE